MLIIGGLASGPQIAPTVPPQKYGQAAIAFIVRNSYCSATNRSDCRLASVYTFSHSTYPGVPSRGLLRPRCA